MKWLIKRRRERVIAFAGTFAEPGEHPLVVLPTLMRGAYPGILGVLPLVVFGLVLVVSRSFLAALLAEFLLLGLVALLIHARALVLTETRVLFFRCNPLFLQPTRLDGIVARADLRVVRFRPGPVWSRLVLRGPDGDRPFWCHRLFRSAARDLYAALGPADIERDGSVAGALPPPII